MRYTVEHVRLLGAGPVVDLDVDAERGLVTDIRTAPTERGDRSPGVLLPGLVDLHTHLREPGGEVAETIATGTRAAAAGGYTDVFAMANTRPVADSPAHVAQVRERAAGAAARVHPVAALSRGLAGTELVDFVALRGAGVRIFSDDGHCLEDDGLVRSAMLQLASLGGVFAQHAQSTAIVGAGVVNARVCEWLGVPGWPTEGEEAVVARDLALARVTGCHLHVCHVSTSGTVALLRWAKAEGIAVTAEVTPHHLALTDEDAVLHGPALKVNPPLRSPLDGGVLREALRDGTIDVVATDHAPHPAETKRLSWQESAFGLTGLETALSVTADVLGNGAGVDWARLVEVMSSVPARIGGIDGLATLPVEVSAPASFCVVESGGPWPVDAAEHLSRSRNTPFQGHQRTVRPVLTVLQGHPTFDPTGAFGGA